MSTLFLLVLAFAVTAGVAIGFAVARRARRDAGSAAPPAAAPASRLDDVAFDQRLRAEIAGGRTIAAIKLVRERTGLGLKEAKDAVDAMAAGKAGSLAAPAIAPGDALQDEAFLAQLLLLIAADNRIEAIRLYRERTGLGLKEARDAVEALERGG